MRQSTAVLLLLACVAAPTACSATKATFKSLRATEQGTDGWKKGGVSEAAIEAVRGTERVVIAPGRTPETYVVKIDPKALEFPTPPWGDERTGTDAEGLQGVARIYRIPRGRSWEDVRQWYLTWFNFKPIGQ